MNNNAPEQHGFDNSWAAWKDRLGIAGVLIALLLLFFFMFTDASFNFQCSVVDFVTFKCNRFNREFVPWDKLEEKRKKSSFAPSVEIREGKIVAIRRKAFAVS